VKNRDFLDVEKVEGLGEKVKVVIIFLKIYQTEFLSFIQWNKNNIYLFKVFKVIKFVLS